MESFEERNAEICLRYSQGATVAELAEHALLTRQRIKQILKRAGVWKKPAIRDQFLGVNVSEETKIKLQEEAERRGVSMSKLTSDVLDGLLK